MQGLILDEISKITMQLIEINAKYSNCQHGAQRRDGDTETPNHKDKEPLMDTEEQQFEKGKEAAVEQEVDEVGDSDTSSYDGRLL